MQDALESGLYVEVISCKHSLSGRYRALQRTERYGHRLSIRLIGEPGSGPPFYNIGYSTIAPGAVSDDPLPADLAATLSSMAMKPTGRPEELLSAALREKADVAQAARTGVVDDAATATAAGSAASAASPVAFWCQESIASVKHIAAAGSSSAAAGLIRRYVAQFEEEHARLLVEAASAPGYRATGVGPSSGAGSDPANPAGSEADDVPVETPPGSLACLRIVYAIASDYLDRATTRAQQIMGDVSSEIRDISGDGTGVGMSREDIVRLDQL